MVLIGLSDSLVKVVWGIHIKGWHRSWIEITIKAIYLETFFLEHIMAAEPDEIVNGDRTASCHTVAIVLETTGIIRIAELLEALDQSVGTEESYLEKLDLLVGNQLVCSSMIEHRGCRLVVAVLPCLHLLI